MPLDPERWIRLEFLFGSAVDLDPAARARYVERECAGDVALLRALESLLRHDAGSS